MFRAKAAYARTLRFALPVPGALAIIGLGVYLSATSDDPHAKGKTTIRWVVDPHKIRKITIALFEHYNPDIHVNNDPDVGDPNTGDQRLLTQLAGDYPPDVMALYTPENIRMFAQNDLLLDLRPYLKKYGIHVEDLYPQLKPYMSYKDRLIGIPENCYALSVFYNKKLFREAGVAYPRPHWTWPECLDAARKLTKYQTINNRQVPIQKGLYVPTTRLHAFVWMYGGQMFSADGKKCLIDQERARPGRAIVGGHAHEIPRDSFAQRDTKHCAHRRIRSGRYSLHTKQGRHE